MARPRPLPARASSTAPPPAPRAPGPRPWSADWPSWTPSPPPTAPVVRLVDRRTALVPYEAALADQHAAVAAVLEARAAEARDDTAGPRSAGTLLLLQHPPVYTLGAGATLDNLKFDPAAPPAPLHRVERGGEATHHCPGQLVLYPILDLTTPGLLPDLHWWLRGLEEVALRAVAAVGRDVAAPALASSPAAAARVAAALADGGRVEGLTGAWVAGAKLAAVGVRASRWVTYHGVALNVTSDLAGFSAIVPCGIADRPVGSVASVAAEAAGEGGLPAELVGRDASGGPLVDGAADALLAAFEGVFGVMLVVE